MESYEINTSTLLDDRFLPILTNDRYWPDCISDIVTLTINKVKSEVNKNKKIRTDLHICTRAVIAETLKRQGGANLNWPAPETWAQCIEEFEQIDTPEFKDTGLASDKRPRTWAKRVSSFVKATHEAMDTIHLSKDERRLISESFFCSLSFISDGRPIYLPKTEYLYRTVFDKIIYQEFSGNNMLDLCLKYNISAASVSKAVKRHINDRRYLSETAGIKS